MPMPVTKQSTWMQEVILYVLIQPPVAQWRFVLSLFEHGKLHEIGHVGLFSLPLKSAGHEGKQHAVNA